MACTSRVTKDTGKVSGSCHVCTIERRVPKDSCTYENNQTSWQSIERFTQEFVAVPNGLKVPIKNDSLRKWSEHVMWLKSQFMLAKGDIRCSKAYESPNDHLNYLVGTKQTKDMLAEYTNQWTPNWIDIGKPDPANACAVDKQRQTTKSKQSLFQSNVCCNENVK